MYTRAPTYLPMFISTADSSISHIATLGKPRPDDMRGTLILNPHKSDSFIRQEIHVHT